MVKYAISDHGIIEANIVPEDCLGPPGGCPPGLYQTHFLHDKSMHRFVNPVLYFLDTLVHDPAHLDRINASILNLQLTLDMKRLEGLEKGSARLRIMVFDEPVELADGRVTLGLSFLKPETYPREYTTPFRCAIAARRRYERTNQWHLKRLGRKQIDEDLDAARQQGFDDVLYLDRLGRWCEASYSNIVAVFGKRVCIVAPEGLCYHGHTARAVGDLKDALKPIQIEQAAIDMREIAMADEVFLTSSIRGLQPVTEIDGVGTWPLDPPNSVRKRIYNEMINRGLI